MHAITFWPTRATIYAAVTITYSGLALSCGGGGNPVQADAAPADAAVDATPDAPLGPPPAPANLNFDNGVWTSVHAGDAWYVGGAFTVAQATHAANALALNLDGSVAARCNFELGFDGQVVDMLQVGNALYAGGAFQTYRGQTANHIAKIDATTCALDTTFTPPQSTGFDNSVRTLLIANNALYVGGVFSEYRGVADSAHGIAKLNLITGAADNNFHGGATGGTNGAVLALAASATQLYIGGSFSRWRQVESAESLVAVNLTTGTSDATFRGNTATTGFENQVRTLAWSGTALYVVGDFTTYRGIANSARHIAKLSVTGALDTTFHPVSATGGFDGDGFSLALDGNSLFVGGSFSAYRGVADSAVQFAKLNATTGALDTVFGPGGRNGNGFDARVDAIAVSGNAVYVGGVFNSYRNVSGSARGLIKLNTTTGAVDTSFLPIGDDVRGVRGNVDGLTLNGATLMVSGSFKLYGGKRVNRIAKFLDATGALDTTFSQPAANGFDGDVQSLVSDGTALFVGGDFAAYRGVADSAFHLAKLNLVTGALDLTFSPPGGNRNGTNGTINVLAIAGNALYAGGSFTAYRGTAGNANRILKLDTATGALDTAFVSGAGNGFNDNVNALAVQGNGLFVGGRFDAYRGVANTPTIAKLDTASGALDTAFMAGVTGGFDSDVYALTVAAGNVFVGGDFSSYNGIAGSANGLAKLNASNGSLDTGFGPALLNGFNGSVNAVLLQNNALYVGGEFTAYRGQPASANYIAKIDATTGGLDTAFTPSGPSVPTYIGALALYRTGLMVGGDFRGCIGAVCFSNAVRVNRTTRVPE